MLKRKIHFCLYALFILLSVISFSGLLYAAELPTLHRGIRPLGMGGAFITLSDDENAMFYNPAGLNDVEGFGGVEIINPLVEVSKDSIDLYKDLQDIDSNNTTQVTDLLNRFIGEHQHLRTSLFPNVVFHNFGIGVLGQATLDAEIRNRADPRVIIDAKVDVGLLASAAYAFYDKTLQIGVTGKYIQRRGVVDTFTAVDIASDNFDPLSDVGDSKKDFAFDLGAKVNIDMPVIKPTFAIVLQNITDLDFDQLGKLPQQLNIGLAINPDFWIVKSTLAAEIDDITKEIDTDDDIYKRVHIGAEVRFPTILAVRAGFNQGYWTAGVTLDVWILKIAYATYAEEVGAVAGQRDDRRHVAQVVLGF